MSTKILPLSAALLLTVGVALAAWPVEAAPDLPSGQGNIRPGTIAFVSARDGNNEIYLMDADGSNPTRLTNDGAADIDPDISPDGRYVIYTSNRGGNNDIYLQGLDGTTWNLTAHPANDG